MTNLTKHIVKEVRVVFVLNLHLYALPQSTIFLNFCHYSLLSQSGSKLIGGLKLYFPVLLYRYLPEMTEQLCSVFRIWLFSDLNGN